MRRWGLGQRYVFCTHDPQCFSSLLGSSRPAVPLPPVARPQRLGLVKDHRLLGCCLHLCSSDSSLQSGHNVRLLAGHCDSVQSSDFSPTANALVSLIPAPPCQWLQEWLRAGSYSWSLPTWDSTVHIWDLQVSTPAVSYQELEGHTGNISCLCYSASGLLWGSWPVPICSQTQGCRPLCSSLSSGIWLLGQDHPHLEAHNQQPSFPAQGTCHLGEEPSLFSQRAEVSQCWLLWHSKSTQIQGTPPPNLSLPMLDDAHRPSCTARAQRTGLPHNGGINNANLRTFHISVLEDMQVAL